ncbi:hypothetical protein TIFTF001_043267 [Ficus carica]|uniref:Uncharacterized protein n=1 Tax=Ficus carica TaxID=3494 RepID=A0AA87Z3Z7_FICCA|nr:hypothetical protein TIFTF001_043267 [Ficus carica]
MSTSVADKRRNGLRLKAVVDREKSKVIFIEADSDFVDVLLSFLTIPIGTAITLAQKQLVSTGMGCVINVHTSVKNMDLQYLHFQSEAGKIMLLSPCTEAASYCEKLKLKIDNADHTEKVFCCSGSESDCTRGTYKLLSPYKDVLCKCGSPMNLEMFLKKSLSEQHMGGFVNEKTKFLVTDELQVIPLSTAANLSLSAKHGVTDDSFIEEIVFDVRANEILKLLFCSVVTNSPLTEILMKHIDVPPLNCLSLRDEKIFFKSAKAVKSTTDREGNNITVKLMFSKYKNIVCYAEANKDFVNLLFSFLTVPLNYMAKNLSDVSFRGCIHHLYKSAQDLGERFFKSQSHKSIPVNPCLPYGFSYGSDLLGIGKASHPIYYYAYNSNIIYPGGYYVEPLLTNDKSLICSSRYEGSVPLKVIGSTSDNTFSNGNDGGIVSVPTTMFIVTDSLTISLPVLACPFSRN